MPFLEWATARGYRVRRGDGEPLRGWPYGFVLRHSFARNDPKAKEGRETRLMQGNRP
jgi:hypothetical protein